ALISVSDKTGIIELARGLMSQGIEIIATGGTAALLHDHSVALTTVADYTGFPEIMGGRVKTLHPKIYAALLRRPGLDDPVLQEHHIQPIDLLVVNLYPFEKTPSIEQIDVGGPAMLRAAAKNHEAVTVVVDPADYPLILESIQKQEEPHAHIRQQLA